MDEWNKIQKKWKEDIALVDIDIEDNTQDYQGDEE